MWAEQLQLTRIRSSASEGKLPWGLYDGREWDHRWELGLYAPVPLARPGSATRPSWQVNISAESASCEVAPSTQTTTTTTQPSQQAHQTFNRDAAIWIRQGKWRKVLYILWDNTTNSLVLFLHRDRSMSYPYSAPRPISIPHLVMALDWLEGFRLTRKFKPSENSSKISDWVNVLYTGRYTSHLR
jgi:hypothetical protein